MNIRYSLMFFASFFCFAATQCMEKIVVKKETTKVVLPNKTSALLATEEFKNRINKNAHVGNHYDYLIQALVKKQPEVMKSWINGMMKNFGSYVGGNYFGFVGRGGAAVVGYFLKNKIVEGLQLRQMETRTIFETLDGVKREEEKEKMRFSILEEQKKGSLEGTDPDILTAQLLYLGSGIVIDSMNKDEKRTLKEIMDAHDRAKKRDNRKDNPFETWGMNKLIPKFICYCGQNKQKFQTSLAKLHFSDCRVADREDGFEVEKSGIRYHFLPQSKNQKKEVEGEDDEN